MTDETSKSQMPDGIPSGTLPANGFATGPEQRLDQARDIAIALSQNASNLCWRIGKLADDYKKLLEDKTKTDAEIDRSVFEFAEDLSARLNQLDDGLAQGRTFIEPFEKFYDGFSVGPATIGRDCFSNAHIAAYRIARQMRDALEMGKQEIFPPNDPASWMTCNDEYFDALSDPNVSKRQDRLNEMISQLHPVKVNRDTIPKWLVGAQKLYGQMLGMMGQDYGQKCNGHVELIRIEAALAVAAIPNDLSAETSQQKSGRSDEHSPKLLSGLEELVVNTLKKAGRPLTQVELLAAAHLTDSGTNKHTLGQLVERNILLNHGKGYFLPEWNK